MDAPSQPPARPRILIIDDLRDSLDFLTTLLQRYVSPCEVTTATSGQEGLALAQRLPPDLILLDVSMPHMDGFEACRRLKAQAETASVPVLMVSGVMVETQAKYMMNRWAARTGTPRFTSTGAPSAAVRM